MEHFSPRPAGGGAGRLSRRDFVEALVTLGLASPGAAGVLAAVGHARAQTPAPAPARRGGGDVRVLMWQAPTALNPHLGVGLKDAEAARIFYEPLAAYDADGLPVPVLAEAVPTPDNGGLAPDGLSVTWRLKKQVRWHDGSPFTADDVVFNWELAVDPAAASVLAGPYRPVARVEALDPHTVRFAFRQPTPAWASVMCGLTREIVPRHVFAPYRSARLREAPATLRPVGTGPYRLVEFRPVAHCHLGLGKLFGRTGDRAQAEEHLGSAKGMYSEMDMGFWLAQAEAALGGLER